jgi:rhodanese-related sulfurtransferase
MKTKKIASVFAVIAIAVVGLAACGSSSSVTNLNSNDFATKIADQSVVVLDVRTPAEFSAGHIDRAINIDVDASTFTSEIAKLDKSKTYAVYCHSGRRSGIATAQMAKSGFTHIFNLTSGVSDWLATGHQIGMN